MTTAGYFNSGKKLDEGKKYSFIVQNIVMLQDEKAYYILEDPFKIKHLLPYWFYTNYGIQQGQSIICIVDKINCTGRVFLEPEHPYYSKGTVSGFKFKSVRLKELGRKAKLIVTDIFENEIEVGCPEQLAEAVKNIKHVECIVVSICKGRPVLALTRSFRGKLSMLIPNDIAKK